MSTTRRTFLKVIAGSGGAFIIGIGFSDAATEKSKPFQPNAWLRIDPDGTVHVRVGKSEMGQGVRTALPMIVAEELDADLKAIRIEQASPGPDFKGLGTGGSGSMMGQFDRLRTAGAAARSMLIAAAAQRWNVSPDTCQTAGGWVTHSSSSRRLSYGELATDAAKQPVPEKPILKDVKSFRIIGRSQKRLDGSDIITGRAKYGLDVRVPGMLYAVIARAPRFGSKVVSFNSGAALKVSGVRHVLQVPSGIAVVARNTWAAMRGREALKIEWSESPHATFDSREHMKVLERSIEKPALVIHKHAEGRAAFKDVARTIEATYLYPFAAHASLEPVNCTALVTEDKCTIWSPTQTPNGVQNAAVQMLGMSESAVTVNVMLLGGGFGRRLGVDFDKEALEIARQVKGTPV